MRYVTITDFWLPQIADLEPQELKAFMQALSAFVVRGELVRTGFENADAILRFVAINADAWVTTQRGGSNGAVEFR